MSMYIRPAPYIDIIMFLWFDIVLCLVALRMHFMLAIMIKHVHFIRTCNLLL